MSEKSSKLCFCFKTKGEAGKDLTYTKRPRNYDEIQIEDGKTEMTNKEKTQRLNYIEVDVGPPTSTQILAEGQGVQYTSVDIQATEKGQTVLLN